MFLFSLVCWSQQCDEFMVSVQTQQILVKIQEAQRQRQQAIHSEKSLGKNKSPRFRQNLPPRKKKKKNNLETGPVYEAAQHENVSVRSRSCQNHMAFDLPERALLALALLSALTTGP